MYGGCLLCPLYPLLVQDIIFPSYILATFPPSKSVCRIFFLKSLITPSKVKCSAPKIHQTFAQLTDSDLSIISKAFWNNRGQNSLGERGGILFYLPLPGESVWTYGDVITEFSRIDNLPNFLRYGASRSCARSARRLRYQKAISTWSSLAALRPHMTEAAWDLKIALTENSRPQFKVATCKRTVFSSLLIGHRRPKLTLRVCYVNYFLIRESVSRYKRPLRLSKIN